MIKTLMKSLRSVTAPPALPVPAEGGEVIARTAQTPALIADTGFRKTNRRTFSAGNVSRFSTWLTQDIAINALLESQLAIIRARSRKVWRDTSPGRRFSSLVKNNVVGPSGFRLQSRCGDYINKKWVLDKLANETLEEHFKTWCEPGHCDVTGQSSFTDICRLIAGEGLARDGEFLVKEVIGTKDTPYRYQLQVLSIDRLDINYRGTAPNGNEIRMGVERNSAGKPVAYYVLVRNPNDTLGQNTQAHERIGAEDIIHRFIRVDPEQIRGIPWAHAVMTGQNMLHLFEEAAVQAAVVGASNMGFFIPPGPGDDDYMPLADSENGHGAEVADEELDDGTLVQDSVGGSFRTLPPGWKTAKFDPDYPHAAYDPFVQSRKRDIASGLDVAHHNLSGDLSGVNYSSARIGEMTERDGWRYYQNYLITSFAKRVVSRWLELSLLANALTMPNGSALSVLRIDKYRKGLGFVPRGWDWVDPAKEAQGAKTAIDEGLTTRSKVVASKGGDFEENIIELAREMQILEEYGVTLGGAKPTAPDNDDDTDTQNGETTNGDNDDDKT